MIPARYLGQNVSAVKSRNICAILMNLLYHEPIYRVKLAKAIAISTTTVTKLIDELISLGIVEEKLEEINGLRCVGRPQNAIFLNRDAYHAIGVHIGGGMFRIGVVNLRNEILHNRMDNYDLKSPAIDVMKLIIKKIESMIKECQIKREKILGIGIGAPGLVNSISGEIGYAKNQGWWNVPISTIFKENLGFPVVVENNVRSMALGETLFGVGKDVNTLLFVYGRLGVGAGIVVNHHIYHGSNLGAGEIGHTFIIQNEGNDELLGEHHTLEDLISAPVLIEQARALKSKNPDSLLAKTLQSQDGNQAIEEIYNSARQGDVFAQKLVKKHAQYLGIALVNAVNLINPELILLGGMFNQGIDLYLPVIRHMVDTMTFAEIGKKVKIRETSYGWKAGLLGASALALSNFFYLPPKNEEIVTNLMERQSLILNGK